MYLHVQAHTSLRYCVQTVEIVTKRRCSFKSLILYMRKMNSRKLKLLSPEPHFWLMSEPTYNIGIFFFWHPIQKPLHSTMEWKTFEWLYSDLKQSVSATLSLILSALLTHLDSLLLYIPKSLSVFPLQCFSQCGPIFWHLLTHWSRPSTHRTVVAIGWKVLPFSLLSSIQMLLMTPVTPGLQTLIWGLI